MLLVSWTVVLTHLQAFSVLLLPPQTNRSSPLLLLYLPSFIGEMVEVEKAVRDTDTDADPALPGSPC